MKNINFFGRLQKVNGQLIYNKISDTKAYEEFKKLVPEGAFVELYAEATESDGSLAQLRKCHAMVRELSDHTGFTFSEVKMLAKEKAGLCLIRTISGREVFLCSSLGDCNKEELSAFITACIEIGEEVNHPLN